MKTVNYSKLCAILLCTTIMVQGCSPQKKVAEVETAATTDRVQKLQGKETANIAITEQEGLTTVQVKAKVERKKVMEEVGASSHGVPMLQKRSMVYDAMAVAASIAPSPYYPNPQLHSQESYNPVEEQSFINTLNDSLSTFSIDVDTGSYANIRRFINSNQKVPAGAVRIEEMVNYFQYSYPEPQKGPVAISAELGPCPWNEKHQLAIIGLKAKEVPAKDLAPSNLVFLIDVSGSMSQPQKLPLVKKGMKMLVTQLTSKDRLSIVVYAGSNRVVLPPTPGDQRKVINKAIDGLHSGGSTHGSSAIMKAYELAHQNYFSGGNNRIILASDGDFNVGLTSRDQLTGLIEKEREKGVFLTVLGFGSGNYKDDTMEMLADIGNGNYSYIDSLLEAKKVLIKERVSNLYTLAKDVKLQIEFNPSQVGAYRLVGYDNRVLADEDFTDDTKDAGEIGVGHTVTALYEIIPPGSSDLPKVPQLKYRSQTIVSESSDEVLTVSLRYKEPEGSVSKLTSHSLTSSERLDSVTSADFRFASSVAWFGMYLQKSDYLVDSNINSLIDLAKRSKGADEEGLRAEFIRLVEAAELLEQ